MLDIFIKLSFFIINKKITVNLKKKKNFLEGHTVLHMKSSKLYSLQVVWFTLWKLLCNVFCDSGGRFPNLKKEKVKWCWGWHLTHLTKNKIRRGGNSYHVKWRGLWRIIHTEGLNFMISQPLLLQFPNIKKCLLSVSLHLIIVFVINLLSIFFLSLFS